MTFINWQASIEVGSPAIDDDHRNIFAWINHLHEVDASKMNYKTVGGALNLLMDFVIIHFRREEAAMEACNYPELADHQRAHKEFEEKLNDVQRRHAAGDAEAINREIIDFIKNWFVDHIKNVDKLMAPYVRDNPAAIAAADKIPIVRMSAIIENLSFFSKD